MDDHEAAKPEYATANIAVWWDIDDCPIPEGYDPRLFTKQEIGNFGNGELDPVRNYAAKPEHATAPIMVWWDMRDCPIPEGYDARWVRPSIEAEFKKLGYSGHVSITAFGDHKQTPDHLLQGLSSTGVAVVHTIPEEIRMRMFSGMMCWQLENPPPATMMIVSNHVEESFSQALVQRQQQQKYNLFLAYSSRPNKMSIMVTSAEWNWDSLLKVSQTRRQVVDVCSESTGMFYCRSCFSDCKGLDDFRNHLSSKDHAQKEASMYPSMQLKIYHWPERKRLRKAARTGFRHLHNHLRLTKRKKISNLQERMEFTDNLIEKEAVPADKRDEFKVSKSREAVSENVLKGFL